MIRNIEKIIEQGRLALYSNPYDITAGEMTKIMSISEDSYDLMLNSFRFGYMQGCKATMDKCSGKGAVI